MPQQLSKHYDVMIVGAGISGIASAYHLQTQVPGKSYVVLDAFETFGGTWHYHKYPGLRSDSDLHTFGYRFKPWTGAPIATADKILQYLGEVIADNHLDEHIHYQHKILEANWSSTEQHWQLKVQNLRSEESFEITANFLWMCQGYYRHTKGFTPKWEGMNEFSGEIIHPQHWPEDLDYQDKKVVVIGSGATAATLVPAIASSVKHVTMLQRSPTYFNPQRNGNDLTDTLRALEVDENWIHEITRRKITYEQAIFTRTAAQKPDEARKMLLDGVRNILGDEFDIDTHFAPKYRPWQQRVAFVPDGDLFHAMKSGKASVVTDHIDRFTKNGILLKSGEVLEADIIVTATGFDLCPLGDIAFSYDGEPRKWADSVGFMGIMFTEMPNMAWVCGYFRASWTLRTELVADFVCKLLKHMDANGYQSVEVKLRDEDKDMEIMPWGDENDFNAGYLMRSMHIMPKRGAKPEWRMNQDYWSERHDFAKVDMSNSVFNYRK